MGMIVKNDTMEMVYPKNEKFFTLEELQGFVGGDIETFSSIKKDMDKFHLFCNDNGAYLELNKLATTWVGHPIHGNMVMCELGEIE